MEGPLWNCDLENYAPNAALLFWQGCFLENVVGVRIWEVVSRLAAKSEIWK